MGGDEGSPGRHPDGNALPPAPPSPRRRPHRGRRTPEDDGAQSWSLRTLAPHARSAPFAAGRDRGCGRVRSTFGGLRPAPPRLLGNVHASPLLLTWVGPTTHISTYNNKGELLKVTEQQPVPQGIQADREGREWSQRQWQAPSTGKVSLFACPRSPGSQTWNA